jgi:hypothetical protein
LRKKSKPLLKCILQLAQRSVTIHIIVYFVIVLIDLQIARTTLEYMPVCSASPFDSGNVVASDISPAEQRRVKRDLPAMRCRIIIRIRFRAASFTSAMAYVFPMRSSPRVSR